MNTVQEKIYNIIASSHELDTPADIMYNINNFLKDLDGINYRDYLDSDEFKNWLSNKEEFLDSWKKISTFMLLMIEKEKDYL